MVFESVLMIVILLLLRRICMLLLRLLAFEVCSSRRSLLVVAHRRPLASVSSGLLFCRLVASTRWLVKEISVVMPSIAGAASALCTACASGLGGGVGPEPLEAR